MAPPNSLPNPLSNSPTEPLHSLMFESAKILLLGKTVMLTATPVDIGPQWAHLTPPHAISAITKSAHVEIHVPWSPQAARAASLRAAELEARYFHRCVSARLFTKGRQMASFALRYTVPEKSTGTLVLMPKIPVPVGVAFDQLQIRATCPLSHVTVEWRNDGSMPDLP